MPEAGDSRSLHVLALVRVRSRPASPRPSRSGWYGYFRGWQLPENQTCHGPKHARPMCSGRPLKYSQTLCYSYDTEWYRETHARTPRSKNRGVFVDAKHPPVGFEPTALGSEDQRSTSELRGDRPRTGSHSIARAHWAANAARGAAKQPVTSRAGPLIRKMFF